MSGISRDSSFDGEELCDGNAEEYVPRSDKKYGSDDETGPYVTVENITRKTDRWKKQLASYNVRMQNLNPATSALLVIDMQNYFLDSGCSAWMEAAPAIVPNVRALIDIYRSNGLPVLFTSHVHENPAIDGGMMSLWWGNLIMKDTHDAEIYPEIAPVEGEKVVQKTRYSAFYNTDLDISLRRLGVEEVVITGVMTNLCCESTARDAFFRDYRVFFIMDATASVIEEFHISTLKNLAYGFAHIVNTAEILHSVASG